MSSVKTFADNVQTIKLNAAKLRNMAQGELDNNVKKLLMEAAHHLDVSVAQLDYIITSATVAT